MEVSRTVATGDLQHNDLELSIGSRLDSEQSFVGILDDVRLYNRTLSQDEIVQIMEGEIGAAVASSGKLTSTWGAIKGR